MRTNDINDTVEVEAEVREADVGECLYFAQ